MTRLPLSLLRITLPRAERDELLADIRAEAELIERRDGAAAASRWLWRQALKSAPGLLTLSWRRAT
jgi:putative ABC transport system permease protein